MAHTLGSIASKHLVTIGQDERLDEAIRLISARHLSALVVVDRSGVAVGLLSTTDIARHALHVLGTHVRDAMTPTLFTLDAATPVALAARLIAASHLHRVVVTEHGKIVGIVSLTDIARLVGEVGLRDDAVPGDAPATAGVDIGALRDIFAASVARCGAALVDTLYDELLASSPQMKSMFANVDMAKQKRAIVDTFALAIEVSNDDPGALARLSSHATVHDREHRNVAPELYEAWLESAITAVRKHDPSVSPAVEQAWRVMIGNVASFMSRRY